MTQAQQLANLSQVYTNGCLGLRNRIINGGCQIGQRSPVNHAAGVSTYGAADRFYVYSAGSTAVSANDWNALPGYNQACHVTATAAGNTSIAFGTRIEANNIYDLASQPVTFSGLLYTDYAVTPSIAANTPTAVDNWASANWTAIGSLPALVVGWNYVTLTFNAPAAATLGMCIEIAFTNVPNGKNIGWTGLQLESGTIVTPFDRRPRGLELMLCQRYWETGQLSIMQCSTASGIYVGSQVKFAVPKRIGPNVTLARLFTSGSIAATSSPSGITNESFLCYATTTGTGGVQAQDGWTANAEL